MLAFPVFQRLVDDCQAHNLPLLMLSDSRVFTLVRNQRYREQDVPAPTSAVGEQLLRYEQYLTAHCERHIILRTGSVLASSGSNLLVELVRQLQRGGVIYAAGRVAAKARPVLPISLRVIAAICDQVRSWQRRNALWHHYRHSSDAATFYELAEVVGWLAASQFWQLERRTCTAGGCSRGARRGLSAATVRKIRELFGIQRKLQWRKAIPDLLKQMQASEAT